MQEDLSEGEMMGAMAERMFGQRPRKLALDKCANGFGVSTTWTPDEGYETAIFAADFGHAWIPATSAAVSGRVHVVERYQSEEEAHKGHKRWVEEASKPTGRPPVIQIRPIMTVQMVPLGWRTKPDDTCTWEFHERDGLQY